MTYRINDKAVYRTAPATPGLVISFVLLYLAIFDYNCL